jgi:hypothetical protein
METRMASAKVALAADAMRIGDEGAISSEDGSKLDDARKTVVCLATECTTAWAVAPRAPSSDQRGGLSRSPA